MGFTPFAKDSSTTPSPTGPSASRSIGPRRTLPLPEVHNHLGVALARAGKTSEAVEAYRTALRLRPDFAPAHINLGRAYLALGRLEEAWMEQEWRWSSMAARPFKFRKPRWNGSPLTGRTVLVYADETADDVKQYIQYAVALRELGGRVVVACRPELTATVLASPGVDAVHVLGDSLPEHDLYVPLLSLPWLLSKNSRVKSSAEQSHLAKLKE